MIPKTTGRRMKLGLFPRADLLGERWQMPSFREIQAEVQAAEQIGLDSFWLADHLLLRYPDTEDLGCWEVFTFLSGLASVTSLARWWPAPRFAALQCWLR